MEFSYFECQCGSLLHTLRFVLDPIDGEVWTETHLCQWHPWYRRLWIAVKYVFKRSSRFGSFDVTMLREDDYPRLHDLLDRSSLLKKQETVRQAARVLQEKQPTER